MKKAEEAIAAAKKPTGDAKADKALADKAIAAEKSAEEKLDKAKKVK